MKKNWKIFLIIGIILLILCTSAIISSLAEKFLQMIFPLPEIPQEI